MEYICKNSRTVQGVACTQTRLKHQPSLKGRKQFPAVLSSPHPSSLLTQEHDQFLISMSTLSEQGPHYVAWSSLFPGLNASPRPQTLSSSPWAYWHMLWIGWARGQMSLSDEGSIHPTWQAPCEKGESEVGLRPEVSWMNLPPRSGRHWEAGGREAWAAAPPASLPCLYTIVGLMLIWDNAHSHHNKLATDTRLQSTQGLSWVWAGGFPVSRAARSHRCF